MLILQTLLEELTQLKTVYACMKKIMEFYGSIKIGELALQKFEDQGALLFLLFALWLITSMDFFGTFIRQEKCTPHLELSCIQIFTYDTGDGKCDIIKSTS